jgi:hypothetical protein
VDAERLAEIANTRLWADGKPPELNRLPDRLEARLPGARVGLLSAFADGRVIDFMGDTFVSFLADYAQSRPIAANARLPGCSTAPATIL